MEYLKYVEAGKEKAGSWKALAAILAVPQTNMSAIKNGVRGMSEDQMLRLSMLIEVEFVEIMATQKVERANTDEERQLWLPFVKSQAFAIHAAVILAICAAGLLETFFVSPSAQDPHLALLFGLIPSLLC
jgi:hypothetical protein